MKGRKDGQAWYAYRALHRVTRSASEHRISHLSMALEWI